MKGSGLDCTGISGELAEQLKKYGTFGGKAFTAYTIIDPEYMLRTSVGKHALLFPSYSEEMEHVHIWRKAGNSGKNRLQCTHREQPRH